MSKTARKKYDVLVIGDCAIDQYMDLEDSSVLPNAPEESSKICFIHGSKIPVTNFSTNFAGNAAHVSVGVARLELSVGVYTELGNDDNGRGFLKLFQKEKIDTTHVRLSDSYNTNVHTVIWHSGERTIFSFHEKVIYNLDFKKVPSTTWIYYTSLADNFEEFQSSLVDHVKTEHGPLLAFNPGSHHLKKGLAGIKNALEITTLLFLNKEEAEYLTKDIPNTALKQPSLSADNEENQDAASNELKILHMKLQTLGPKMTVITDGKEGSSAHSGEEFIMVPASKIEELIVDKTGAGDAYAAAFLAALIKKKPLKTAMAWGTKNSASIITHVGCIGGLLDANSIE